MSEESDRAIASASKTWRKESVDATASFVWDQCYPQLYCMGIVLGLYIWPTLHIGYHYPFMMPLLFLSP